jgi:hypothetical protein
VEARPRKKKDIRRNHQRYRISKACLYVDESDIEGAFCKDRGWCQKEEKLIGKKSGKDDQRTHMTAGLVNHHPIAPMVFNGSCNTLAIQTFLTLGEKIW